MAVTSIWAVHGDNVATVMKYIANQDKTDMGQFPAVASFHAVNRVLQYGADEMKTEQQLLVTGILCDTKLEIAARQFLSTKIHHGGKVGGIVCFHAYQSFKRGEVDGMTAHKIGVELAKRMWGDRFEVMVSTHMNTGTVHNHFCLNSVSFADGKKYYSGKALNRKLREVSDALCREYGLSVIAHPAGQTNREIGNRHREENGLFTWRSQIKKDMDEAIARNTVWRYFADDLQSRGYTLEWRGKYLRIRPDGAGKFFRLDRLGEGYTVEDVRARLEENWSKPRPFFQPYNEAKSYFNRVESEFAALFLSLGSRLEPLDAAEKLRVLFDFYHYGAEDDFLYEPERYGRRGYTFKDAIAPDSMEFRSDCFRIDGRYGRVLYLRDYANFIKDSFLAELTDIDRGLMFSIDCNPIPTDEAIRQGEGKLLAVETNISNWQRKQNRNQNFSADVPYDMEKQRAESREFLDDLVSRDQRMIPSLMTLCHTAESKEQLDADTESIRQCARKHLCSMNVLRWQQLEGLNTVLPYGVPKLSIRRTLTTEALAVFMPFRVQEICHRNGIYFANNAISKNLMTVNRAELQNGNAFICGVSGSGKSLLAKQEAISLYLSDPNADILIIDPEREYGKICDALGGETITVSAASPHHINALDMSRSYGDESNPVTLKSEFLCSLCEEAAGKLTAGQKSVIDRCTASVYREYLYSGCTGKVSTLKDFYEVLKAQPEPEAQSVALSMELFINGTLNTFAKETNVDTQNRLLCYDIHDLGKTLMPIGMLVVLDSILNRITANRENGRKTYVFLDEIYLLFRHAYAANFLFTLWKRARKYGAFITGITQNVEDLLQSHTARTMLANSELVVMLNQAATDRAELAALMGISDAQMSYITNAEVGHGLVKIGGALVPFVNRMKKGTELYLLCTTKPGEC